MKKYLLALLLMGCQQPTHTEVVHVGESNTGTINLRVYDFTHNGEAWTCFMYDRGLSCHKRENQ